MPTESINPMPLLAHCPDPRCKGNAQSAAQGLEITTSWTYAEHGGDFPGVEKSTVRYQFANMDDAPCKACRKQREIGPQVRPKYESLSGFPQDQLLHMEKWNPEKAGEVAELVDRLTEKLK